jgi:hypothetical protein
LLGLHCFGCCRFVISLGIRKYETFILVLKDLFRVLPDSIWILGWMCLFLCRYHCDFIRDRIEFVGLFKDNIVFQTMSFHYFFQHCFVGFGHTILPPWWTLFLIVISKYFFFYATKSGIVFLILSELLIVIIVQETTDFFVLIIHPAVWMCLFRCTLFLVGVVTEVFYFISSANR